MEIWSDGGWYRKGFDGKAGWIKDRCGVRDNDNAGRDKLAFLFNPQGALKIEEYFPELKYDGIHTFDDSEVYALKPSGLKPENYTLYFSAETGLLVRIGYYWTIQDYRKVDGIMCPFRIHTSRKGGSAVYEIKSISHNVEVKDSIFEMPADEK